jgi:hypothetical protein
MGPGGGVVVPRRQGEHLDAFWVVELRVHDQGGDQEAEVCPMRLRYLFHDDGDQGADAGLLHGDLVCVEGVGRSLQVEVEGKAARAGRTARGH